MTALLWVLAVVWGFALLVVVFGHDDDAPSGGDPVDEYIRFKKRRES